MTAYWRLWWAAAVDATGDGVAASAVPLVALTLTHDPRLVSLVSAAAYLPWLLLSLPVGALVDRRDRVGLMWRAQAMQAFVAAVAGVLAAAGALSIPVLALVALGIGAGDVVFSNASQAVLPELVPPSLLHKANGRQYAVTTAGQLFLGPPLGGLLLTVAIALPFGVDAASFAVSAVLVATLPRRRPSTTDLRDGGPPGRLAAIGVLPGHRWPVAGRPPVRAAIVDGLRWLLRHRLLRTLAVLLGVNTFCFSLGNVTLVLLATQVLHLSARGYGLLLAGGAIGSILGGVANARIVARIGALPSLLTALAVNAVIFVAIGFSPDALVLGALLAVNGFVTTLWNIVTVSLRQQTVPAELLGRVNSVYKLLGWGLIPLGALAGGLLAHGIGLRAAYPVAGALRGIALLAALPVLVTAMRETTRPAPPTPQPSGE